MRSSRTITVFALGLTFLATGACGELGGSDAPPATLATISGALSDLGDLEIKGELRVALVWRNGSSDYAPGTGDPYNIAEDVPVTAELPARFTLELTGPPPAIAMRAITSETADTDFPPGSSYARGALVVYDDLDRDGRLDLADAGATEEVDRLVGARGDLEVWYVAGGVPRTGHLDGGGQPDFLQLGYQVVIWDGERGRTVDSVDLPLTVADELRSIGCVDPMGPPSELRDHGTDAPAAYPTAPDTLATTLSN